MKAQRQRRIRNLGIAAVTLVVCGVAAGASAAPGDAHNDLARNINPGAGSSNPSYLTVAADTMYFAAYQPTLGTELWKTTSAGLTSLVKNLAPGTDSSAPHDLVAVGSRVFFAASGASGGIELYVSDGTGAGTNKVREINFAGDASPEQLTNVNGTLYFTATEETGGRELWKSDGTAAGTRRVRDIAAGTTSSDPAELTDVNGTLFFMARNQLWKSDGTTAGTVPVKAVANSPQRLTAVGDKLFYNPAVGDRELWVSDGTAAGTHVVRNIDTAGSSDPQELSAYGSFVLFSAQSSTGDRELYRSDGTAAGTIRVRNINTNTTGMPYEQSSNPFGFAEYGGNVYFTVYINGFQLWRTDGSFAGTQLVKVLPGLATGFTEVGGMLLFSQDNDVQGVDELWQTDGTTAGTKPAGLSEVSADGLYEFANLQDTLYYPFDAGLGVELYKTIIEQ